MCLHKCLLLRDAREFLRLGGFPQQPAIHQRSVKLDVAAHIQLDVSEKYSSLASGIRGRLT